MPRLVAQVHHDRALVLEIVHLALEPRELGIGQVERDADHRMTIGSSPLVGEVAHRAEFLQALALALAMELLHEPFDRRAFEPEPELADALAEDLAHFGRRALEHGRADVGDGGAELAHGAAW